MEFSFDISQTPLIGRRILLKTDTTITTAVTATTSSTGLAGRQMTATSLSSSMAAVNIAATSSLSADSQQQHHHNQQQQQHQQHSVASAVGLLGSPRRSASLSPADAVQLSGWKRPWMSQSRVRECLVSLLTTCGQRVGLPKSPSVSVCRNRGKERR